MYSAVILAGGFGTRLKPLTDTVPKPMLPVGGEPNLVRLCDLLCRNGFDSAVVTLKYMPDKIRDRLTDSCRGVDLYYVCEDEPKGTAGAVKAASPLCRDDFLVISGDAVCEIDLSSAYEAHKKSGAAATIITHRVTRPLEYGCIVCDKNGRIVSFCEKPSWQQVVSDKVNTGIYILSKYALGYIPEGVSCDFSADVFPKMLGNGEFLLGFEAEGSWRDIGSFSEYLAANTDLTAGKARYAETEGSVCGDSFRLGKNSSFINSVAFDGVSIADNCSVTGSILARNVPVGDGCILRDGCVIGEGAVINDGVQLGTDTVIGTGKTVVKSIGDMKMIKNKLFSDGSIILNGDDDVPAQLCRVARAVAEVAEGPVGVCCDSSGKRLNEAGIFSCALCGGGAAVYDLGCVVRYAAASAGAFYGCRVTVFFTPEGDADTRISFFDVTGMELTASEEKRIYGAYRAEQEKKAPGTVRRITGLDVSYYNALSGSVRLDGVRVSVALCGDSKALSDAFAASGADASQAPPHYPQENEYTVNMTDEAALLSQNGFSCGFDGCLLILLSLISPDEHPAVSLPYFLPAVYEKTAKARGIKVRRYLCKPSYEQKADAEARKLRTRCMFAHDPLFCAAKLMAELKRNRMTLKEAAGKYCSGVIVRTEIKVSDKEKASCMRRLYESYMPYQTAASDGVSIVEGGAEGVAMADDTERIKIVISADSEEAASDAVGEIMMRMGKLRS